MAIRMLLAPVVGLLLLRRETLRDVFVITVGFGLPLFVNNGFVLHRLGLGGLVLGGLATGGQNRGGQCDAEQGQTEISSKVHRVSFRSFALNEGLHNRMQSPGAVLPRASGLDSQTWILRPGFSDLDSQTWDSAQPSTPGRISSRFAQDDRGSSKRVGGIYELLRLPVRIRRIS